MCLIILLAAAAPAAFAASPAPDVQPGTGNITGTIRDQSTNETLPFASVEIVGKGYGVASDKNGAFYLSGIPAGTLTLRISYMGYQTQEKSVT
ncbi:MAG TPA: carboxypeptidase-like regulatory domain-containing protein, partial [Anseongella sp.]|nr:carboxypeptidase-like regulatory domain-containing protein [Anseongella sp.]